MSLDNFLNKNLMPDPCFLKKKQWVVRVSIDDFNDWDEKLVELVNEKNENVYFYIFDYGMKFYKEKKMEKVTQKTLSCLCFEMGHYYSVVTDSFRTFALYRDQCADVVIYCGEKALINELFSGKSIELVKSEYMSQYKGATLAEGIWDEYAELMH